MVLEGKVAGSIEPERPDYLDALTDMVTVAG